MNVFVSGPLGVAYKEFSSKFSVRKIRIEARPGSAAVAERWPAAAADTPGHASEREPARERERERDANAQGSKA